ncbi:MAG: efflux RND transporter periplasmic adaptor subunit [Sutterella sp.]|nr:efflux RND transporter periplasmic adaptor subunit [Sutterella sp.]
MIEQTQAQQTQAQAPKRPASSVPLLVGAAFFAGIAAFLGWGVWEATHPAPVPLQGMVDARTISVSAKVPGRLAELKVREGDVLKAGDTVAVIAIPEIEAKLVQVKAQERAAQAREDLANTGARVQEKDAARADWERAKAALTLASKTYERVDALYREGLIPAQRHDEATAQLAAARKVTEAAAAKLSAVDEGARVEDKTAAKALVDQARGGVSEVSSLASESIVKAPAAGEVTRIVMEEGEVAPAGFPLVLVTDLSDKWVVFNIREDELPGVEVGTILKGFIPAVNRTVDLKVNWINPRGEYAVWRATRQSTGYDLRTFEVRARPVEELPALRPGMTVIVER